MSTPAHTPGPWLAIKLGDAPKATWAVSAPGYRNRDPLVCVMEYSRGGPLLWPESVFNARLIAAAPELLDVVKGFRRKLETYVSVYPSDKELRRLLSNCDAAIAKATEARP